MKKILLMVVLLFLLLPGNIFAKPDISHSIYTTFCAPALDNPIIGEGESTFNTFNFPSGELSYLFGIGKEGGRFRGYAGLGFSPWHYGGQIIAGCGFQLIRSKIFATEVLLLPALYNAGDGIEDRDTSVRVSLLLQYEIKLKYISFISHCGIAFQFAKSTSYDPLPEIIHSPTYRAPFMELYVPISLGIKIR